jgi:mitochondrial import inner membrane translocase subunit TIM21
MSSPMLTVQAGVGYLVFSDVLSPNSQTAQFNRAVSRIKASEACTDLLGPAKSLIAYGESPWSSFRRARMTGPVPYVTTSKDPKTGAEEIRMKFLVKGSKDEGWVSLHVQWDKEELEYRYLLLALDVQGHRRVNLEGGKESKPASSSGTLFGIKWR